jgi:L-lactate dehydrogenase complex protein LldF
MTLTSPQFKDNARGALADAQLQRALSKGLGFVERRRLAAERLPEFDALRDAARDIKDHTLAHLDLYLEAYEARVTAAGGKLHYAVTADEARAIVLDICRTASAKKVTKDKTTSAE